MNKPTENQKCGVCGLDYEQHPRCKVCGYTYCDCIIKGDHYLCREPNPPQPVFSDQNTEGK